MNYAFPFNAGVNKDFESLSVFQGVEPEIVRELIASAHTAQYQKGTIFLGQGAPVSRYYILLEGWCGATKGNAEGQEAILQVFRRGDFLLESSSNAPSDISPINLQALTPVHVLMLVPAAVHQAEKASPVFTANMLAANVLRCQDLRDHIEQLTLHTAEERVGRFLLKLRLNTSAEAQDVVLPFDKSMIAAYLGIKPETLSRVFQAFRDKGFAVERGHVTMPSRQALCKFCDKAMMRACPFANRGDCFVMAKETVADSVFRIFKRTIMK